MQEINLRLGWVIFWLLIIGGLIVSFFSWAGIISIGLGVICVAFCFVGIDEPNKALVMQMNRLKGFVGPGFYLPLPFVQKILSVNMDWIDLRFAGQSILGGKADGQQTFIRFEGILTFMVNLEELENILKLSPSKAMEFIFNTAVAETGSELGKSHLQEISQEKSRLERSVLVNTNIALRGYGYTVGTLKFSRLEETTHMTAQAKIILGNADAEVLRKQVEAFAGPLKGNYPAAIALGLQAWKR